MRSFFLLLSLTVLCATARCADWTAEDLGIKLTLPASNWVQIQSSGPTRRLGLGKADRTAVVFLDAKALPPDLVRTEITAEDARAMFAGLTRSSPNKVLMERTTVGRATAYSISTESTVPSGQTYHSEVLFWVHNQYVFALTLYSLGLPVASNVELVALTGSVQFIGK